MSGQDKMAKSLGYDYDKLLQKNVNQGVQRNCNSLLKMSSHKDKIYE